MGRADQMLIGDADANDWDSVALVQYPSRKAFIDMVTTPDYEKAHEHRESGLERTVLHRLHAARRRLLMGRKILFITTDQQRYDALGCNGGDDRAHAGRRRARGRRRSLRARVQPEHRVHAGALDDAHRPVRAHARCDRERRAAARRRAERSPRTCTTRPATAPRCSARRHFEPGFDCKLEWAENFMSERGLVGPYRGFEHAELAMHVPDGRQARAPALRQVARSTRTASRRRRGSRRCSPPSRAARPARPRRASTRSRATGTTPTGSPTARSRTSTRCPTTPTGSCGCRSPTRTTRGTRPRPSCTAATGATSTCRAGHPGIERGDRARARAEARALARAVGRQRAINAEGGPGSYRPQNVSARQHPRDQRDGAHHERADRRGVRSRAAPRRRARAGTPTPT